MTEPRIDFPKAGRDVYRAIAALDGCIELEPRLYELVKLRASHLNGCAFCLDMHATDALKSGESQRRIWAVAAWRESPFFSDREQAALALTDVVTLLPEDGVPDAAWDEAARHFSPDELSNLVGGIIAINAWNRVAVTSRMQPPPLESPATADVTS